MRCLLIPCVLVGVFLTGCAPPTTVAVVVTNDEMTRQVQNIVPTIPLLRPDGKMTTLTEAAGPFYLITFVEAPAQQPNHVAPEVNKIAKQLWLESVNVVQFSEPPEGQTFPADALRQCPPRKDNIILALDPKRSAWEMFHAPAMGTLLLVDKHGYIVDTGSLTNSKNVMFKMYQMAQEWDEKQWIRSFSLDSSD